MGDFYEDKNGKWLLAGSLSPENTPTGEGHRMLGVNANYRHLRCTCAFEIADRDL
jgi:hypothetical protein